jgi:Tfp pilus assembly protein PilE
MKTSSKHNQAGFTAVEMVVSTMIMAILGIVFLNVLNSGMILYAKNTAVNAAHEEGREGVTRFTRDLHAAISVPQLRNSTHDSTYSVAGSFTVPTAAADLMAAGVSFQDVVAGSPDYVWQDPNTATLILIKDPGDQPKAGMRLIAPFWRIEDDIVKVTGNPQNGQAHSNVFLANGSDTTIANKARKYGQSSFSGYSSPYAITYYTERMLYVVEGGNYIADSNGPWILSGGQYVAYTSGNMQRYRYENGQLNVYHQRYSVQNGNNGYLYWCPLDSRADYNPNWYSDPTIKKTTVARYLSSPTPFYVPLVTSSSGTWYASTNSYQTYTTTSNGGQAYSGTGDNRYVGIKLSARDPRTSNRGYLATASLLNTQVDYRSRICLSQ